MPALAVSSKAKYLARLLFLRLRLQAASRGLAAKQVEHEAGHTDKNQNVYERGCIAVGCSTRPGQCSKHHGVGRELHRARCVWTCFWGKLAEVAARRPSNLIWQQASRWFRPACMADCQRSLLVESLACCPDSRGFAKSTLPGQMPSRQGGAGDQPAGWTKEGPAGCQCRASSTAHDRNPPRQAACWGHLPECVP